MNKRELKQYASKHPEFREWVKKNYKKVPLTQKGDYEVLVKEWEKTKKTLDQKLNVRQLAESMQEVQDFVNNMQTVFSHIKTLHEKTKNLKGKTL